MNPTTAIFIMNDTVRAVNVSFFLRISQAVAEKRGYDIEEYTYKTLDQSVKVDDLVVVPTGEKDIFRVGKVVEVDVDIDLEDTIQYKWMVQKVDTTLYDETIAKEKESVAVVMRAERVKKRKRLRKSLTSLSKEELKALPLSHITEE